MLLNDTILLKAAPGSLDFERLYVAVRQQEQRIYTDDQLLQLPDIERSHIHYSEWQIRKQSARRLISYLTKKKKPLSILEIGCGNGWLASRLSAIKGTSVMAIDVNQVEIDQAKRVFDKENLHFSQEDFDPERFAGLDFDIMLFAASLQYFSPVKSMLQKAMTCLAPGGEIYITETRFYDATEINDAAQRTYNYYAKLGYPQMAAYYFHHQISDLHGFNYKILSDPHSFLNRLWKRSPFYQIRINRST